MAIDPKKALGRPTLYRAKYCDALIEHMKQGFSFETFGARVHVSRRTLFDWLNAFPDFKEAYEIGQSYGQFVLEHEGQRLSRGGAGNATVWIFMMKNRFGWRNEPLVEQDQDAEKSELGELSDAEIESRIAAKLQRLGKKA